MHSSVAFYRIIDGPREFANFWSLVVMKRPSCMAESAIVASADLGTRRRDVAWAWTAATIMAGWFAGRRSVLALLAPDVASQGGQGFRYRSLWAAYRPHQQSAAGKVLAPHQRCVIYDPAVDADGYRSGGNDGEQKG